MNQLIQFLNQLKSILNQAAVIFIDIVNSILFIASILLLITSVIVDRRGENIGFSAGKWALICGVAAGGITLAKSVFGIS